MLLTSCCYENKSLNMILEKLNELKLIKEVLASGKKFMGVIQFPGGKARHLDIVKTTKEDYPFAVLYFTGSGPFNIQMRAHALKLGYSLNEYNMTYKGTKNKVTKQDIQAKINKDTFETETDIFNFLNILIVNQKESNYKLNFYNHLIFLVLFLILFTLSIY